MWTGSGLEGVRSDCGWYSVTLDYSVLLFFSNGPYHKRGSWEHCFLYKICVDIKVDGCQLNTFDKEGFRCNVI